MDVFKSLCMVAMASIILLTATVLDRNHQIDTIYSTLSSRCPKESHFEKDTLSCVVTYQLVP